MTVAKHTPGPWHHGVGNPLLVWSGRVIHALTIANCHEDDRPREESIANARLIAAAPEMLSALELAEQAEIETDGDLCIALTERAQEARRAVIAKATGEKP